VRHKVVQVAVVTAISADHGDVAGLNPVFCHRYSIQACAVRKTTPMGVLTGYEALETKVSRAHKGGSGSASGRCYCQHRAVKWLEWRGMVNVREEGK
jgi:hypothetical protein